MKIDFNAKCKSCGKPIGWMKMSSERMMPLDPEVKHFTLWTDGDPKEEKKIFITDHGTVFAGIEVDADEPDTLAGRISHFATCPNADQHRKK